MDQPKFKFGETVQYSHLEFKVNIIEYRTNQKGRPNGYYYTDKEGNTMHHEGALNYPKKELVPITEDEFDTEWRKLLGAVYYDRHTHNTYEGLITFFKAKGLIQ